MTTNKKVFLGFAAGAAVVCLLAAGAGLLLLNSAGRMLNRIMILPGQAVQASDSALAIAEYELPPGFGSGYATRMADFYLTSYTGDDDHSHIYFFQLPAHVQVDVDKMEYQFQQAAQPATNMQVVDQQPATLAGQSVELITSEGTNGEGQPYRQVSAMFQGRGGQAMVVYSSPIATWDQEAVDAFFASIR